MNRGSDHIRIILLMIIMIWAYTAPGFSMEESESHDISTDGYETAFDLSGSIENENLISTYPDQNTENISKKNELRNNIKIQYGTEEFYLRAVTNQYVIPHSFNEDCSYTESFTVSRNGTISGDFYEINAQELYLNISFDRVRFRAGNQIYGWGTADGYNPTSYFNPYDMREFLFKDDDEIKIGVPSLSSLVFLGDFTLELVFTPVHLPSVFPEQDNFWGIHYMEGPFPVYVKNSGGMDVATENFGYGARFGGTVFGFDTSLSAYYGPDQEPLLHPVRTVLVPNKPVSVEVIPEYYNTLKVGADISMKFDKVVVQGEVSYSPDKTAVIDQPYTIDMKMPFEITETETVSYVAGFNYFIPMGNLIEGHEGTAVFTAEWMKTIYFKEGLMEPFLTDFLSFRLEDAYFSDRLKPSVTVVIDTLKTGLIIEPKIGWDFQNGFSFEAAYCHISGDRGSVMGYYLDNDFASIRGRYEY